jgi:hypothetical protein
MVSVVKSPADLYQVYDALLCCLSTSSRGESLYAPRDHGLVSRLLVSGGATLGITMSDVRLSGQDDIARHLR